MNNKRGEILLINPPILRIDGTWLPPLALGYIAAGLENANYKVEIIDCNTKHQHDEEWLYKNLIKFKPNIIGITTYTFGFEHVISICKRIKDKFPAVFIVLGGYHAPPLRYALMKEYSQFDAIIDGPGEEVFLELADRIIDNKSINGIPGLTYRNMYGVIREDLPAKQLESLDKYPFPARHLMPPLTEYPGSYIIDNDSNRLLSAHIITSRGCNKSCIFCAIEKCVQFRDPDKVVNEIEMLINKYNIKSLKFTDPNFLINIDHKKTILNKMHDKGYYLPFQCACRADDIANNEEIVKWLKEEGCCIIEMGAENADNNRLKKLSKGITSNDVKNSIRLLKENGIGYYLGYIMFHPDSTIEEIKLNTDFLRSNNMYNYISSNLVFTKLEVFPNTPCERILRESGLLIEEAIGIYKYNFADKTVEYLWNSLQHFNKNIMPDIENLRKEIQNIMIAINNKESILALQLFSLTYDLENIIFTFIDEVIYFYKKLGKNELLNKAKNRVIQLKLKYYTLLFNIT